MLSLTDSHWILTTREGNYFHFKDEHTDPEKFSDLLRITS